MRSLPPSAMRWLPLLCWWLLLGLGLLHAGVPLAAASTGVQASWPDGGLESCPPALSPVRPAPPASVAWPHEVIADEGFDEPGALAIWMSPTVRLRPNASAPQTARGVIDARQPGLRPPPQGPPARLRPAAESAPSHSGRQRR